MKLQPGVLIGVRIQQRKKSYFMNTTHFILFELIDDVLAKSVPQWLSCVLHSKFSSENFENSPTREIYIKNKLMHRFPNYLISVIFCRNQNNFSVMWFDILPNTVLTIIQRNLHTIIKFYCCKNPITFWYPHSTTLWRHHFTEMINDL